MKQEKKETNAQLKRRIQKAAVFVPRDKTAQECFFDDKGMRLIVTDDYAVVATGYHRHVFDAYNYSSGTVSRPYLYVRRFVEIALENDCTVKDAKGETTRSFAQLFKVLNEKEDKSQYNIARFFQMWTLNIFAPLYEIGETTVDAFLVYERYMHNIARNAFMLEEHKEDVTNKKFADSVREKMQSFMEGVEETVLFPAKTDKERVKEEMESVQSYEAEAAMEQGAEQKEGGESYE